MITARERESLNRGDSFDGIDSRDAIGLSANHGGAIRVVLRGYVGDLKDRDEDRL